MTHMPKTEWTRQEAIEELRQRAAGHRACGSLFVQHALDEIDYLRAVLKRAHSELATYRCLDAAGGVSHD